MSEKATKGHKAPVTSNGKTKAPKVEAKPAKESNPIMLSIGAIRTDGDTQLRCETSEATVSAYHQDLEDGAKFPPVIIFMDDKGRWLADGFLRLEAHKRAGRNTILAIVRKGSQRDALAYALSANDTHGLKRTQDDKRKAVERALADAEWGKWSDRKIADLCAVSHPFVAKMRGGASGNVSSCEAPSTTAETNGKPAERTFQRGGTTSTMNTANIGKKAKAPAPDDVAKSSANAGSVEANQRAAAEADREAEKAPPPVKVPVSAADVKPAPASEEEPATKGKTKPPPEVDEVGIPIQPHAEAAFALVPRMKELLNLIQRAANMVNELAKEDGGQELAARCAGRGASGKADRMVLKGLEEAFRDVKRSIPTYTVCPRAYQDNPQFPHDDTCPVCYGRNWVATISQSKDAQEEFARAKAELCHGESKD